MLREILLPWESQPQEAVAVAWGDPITEGLVGLIWLGPGGPRDLVAQPFALATNAMSLQPRREGLASVVTTPSSSGVYSPRNDYGQWKPASVPLTYAAFFDYTAPPSSRPVAGTMTSNLGYGMLDLYGSRDRMMSAHVGGARRDATGGQWLTGARVRALSVSDTSITGYDDGQRFGSSTFAQATALAYDNTYGRLYLLGSPDNSSTAGEGYWKALWNRVLTAEEHQRLAAEPWCLLAPQRIGVPVATGAVNAAVTLNGLAAAAAAGALVATGAATAAIAGAAAAAAAGVATATSSVATTLPGATATAAAGLIAAAASGNALVTLPGASAAAAAGQLAAVGDALRGITGAAAVATAGNVTATGTSAAIAQITGAAAAAAAGQAVAVGSAVVGLPSTSATASAGTVLANTTSGAAVTLAGAGCAAAAGAVLASGAAQIVLPGAWVAAALGSLAATATRNAVVTLGSASATALAGNLVLGSTEVPLTHHVSIHAIPRTVTIRPVARTAH